MASSSKSDQSLTNSVEAPTEEGMARVDAYFARLTEPQKSTLQALRSEIRKYLPPQATEGFSYGLPAFILKKPVAAYGAWKEHCSYYPMSGRVITALKAELANYATSSGAIRFPSDQPLPAALIQKLLAARLAEIETPKKKM